MYQAFGMSYDSQHAATQRVTSQIAELLRAKNSFYQFYQCSTMNAKSQDDNNMDNCLMVQH